MAISNVDSRAERDLVKESIDATKVDYRRLGNSGLKVSVPILGAMSFGDKRWAPWVMEESEGALDVLKYAYDVGINTWDTANIYSNGESERIIARAIKKFNIPRHKLVIMSKCFVYVGETPDSSTMKHSAQVPYSKDYVNAGGLSRGAIFKAVNASLERLNTDYMDVLQIHRFDPNTPIEETMEALHDLVRSGKVHYIGASSMWAYQFAMMQAVAEKNGWTKFVGMQNCYSLCYREEEREMNKFCRQTGVGLVPWAPLYRGNLARPLEAFGSTTRSSGAAELAEQDKTIIKRVQELADKKGWKMAHVSLAWINEYVSSPIIGFSSKERIDEALGARGKTLTKEERDYLEEPYQPKPVAGHS